MAVEFSTIHHVGFAIGVAGILFAAKCLFDIADSAKRLVAAWVPEDEEEDEEAFDEAGMPNSTVTSAAPQQPSACTHNEDEALTTGAAHVNPDLTTKKTESAS